MVTILRKRHWRIFKENKGRYTGIVILILIGSFYFIAATGISSNLERLVVEFAEQNKQEDLMFTTSEPITDIAALEREFSVTIESYQQHDVEFLDRELRLLSLTSKVNIPAVLSGRELESPGDILLDPRFSGRFNLDIGDQIELNGKTFNITGTMALPNYIYIVKNIYDILPSRNFGIGLISGADFAECPDVRTVYAAYFKDKENIRAQTVNLYRFLIDKGYIISDWHDAKSNIRINMPWGNISSMKSMSLPVSITFFLLSCFIVGVLLYRIIKSDSVIIGTLYAQGFRRSELIRHYLVIPILLSLTGSLTGMLLGLPSVIPVLNDMLNFYILPDLELFFSPINLMLAVFLPMVFISLSCLIILHSTLRKNAVDLMKGGQQKAKVNFIERALRLGRFSFNVKFQIREQLRSIPRLLFLVIGVTLASMILLYGFFFNYSMDLVINQGTLARYNFSL
jgi:putative ABC transport system permease protein